MAKENVLLASLFLNLKGDKNKKEDWISIAKKCDEFSRKYNSHKEVAEKLGVSTELIRAILSLLELPPEIQQLIKQKQILFDAAQRINTITDKKKQIEVARAIAGLTSHEQREIIHYAKKYPNSSLSNFKKRVTTQITKEKIHVAIIPLSDELFKSLQSESIRKKISLEKAVLGIISDWQKKEEKM